MQYDKIGRELLVKQMFEWNCSELRWINFIVKSYRAAIDYLVSGKLLIFLRLAFVR